MAESSRGVLGGFAVLAMVLMGLACPRQAEAGAKEGAVQDPTLPGPKAQLTVDIGGGVNMHMVLIPPGTFDMGSEKGARNEVPVHKVTFKKAFYIGKYEVTQEQWKAVIGVNPSYFKDPKKPVERVSWDGCRNFVAQLSEKTGRKFALPSEAEWEYACRAGSTTEFCFGDGPAGIGEYAWWTGNSHETTHPVGRKKPNKFGLFDMHGNVSEWCEDVYHKTYEGAPTDGSAWVEGGDQGLRVLRGGSWGDVPMYSRSAWRRVGPLQRVTPSIPIGLLTYGSIFGCRVVLRDF